VVKNNGVTICGFYGNYNLGDEAMLDGMIHLLRQQHSNLEFTVFSRDPQDTSSRYSVSSIRREGRRFLIQRSLAIFGNRYFVLGGGDLLRDSTQFSIASSWLRPLQKAVLLNRRTIVLGISVGEIWRPETIALIPRVLNRVDLIAVRDLQSKAKLEALGVRKNIHIISDLALQNCPEIPSASTKFSGNPLQVGISVRHLSGRGPSVDVNVFTDILKELAAIADFLHEKYKATIHFIPFRTHADRYEPVDDDYVAALAVARYSRYSSQFVIHRYFESLQSSINVISQLDLMIGMRLHSLILSAGLGVPIIAAEYDPKVGGFMKEINQTNFSIPLGEFKNTQLLPYVDKIMNDPAKARAEIKAGIKTYRQRMVDFLDDLKNVLSEA
jgi:polysaccharide pyruvyl transferase CsaB